MDGQIECESKCGPSMPHMIKNITQLRYFVKCTINTPQNRGQESTPLKTEDKSLLNYQKPASLAGVALGHVAARHDDEAVAPRFDLP